ncbi:PaREP1 family protein [Pyrolobus fumarii 1A]|uniref:PaREP1 family protein n=1 Tax=Pyrolobus fumarii (strain DSM 11204 / 1A) TaxID=694429 RepID=G0ECT7_PYRF1|nr:PaREP1 family protein [Pyrolobus fumarii]AEM39657.1 PaREP1 family protein [Pyrolobus fumarii 1A]
MCTNTTVITIPEKLAKLIRDRGFDPEAFIMEAIEKYLELDPQEELEARIAVAEHMLMRAREELLEGDAVQASEKLYKAVEECIKVLACLRGLEECRKAQIEGTWWTKLLARAASKLAKIEKNPLILDAWSLAYDAHIHGFHEHSLDPEDIEQRLPRAEELVKYTREALERAKRKSQG